MAGQANENAADAAAYAVQAAILPAVFQQAVDQADLAISITDTHANILYVNPAFTRVTGYTAADVIGHNEAILSNKTTPPEVYRGLWQKISRGESWSGRLVNRRKDGSKYLAELTITPVADAAGHVVSYLGMHRDITEMHRLERQVRNQKALIESVVDAAPIAVALLDGDERVVLDNHEYKKLTADLGMAEPAPLLLAAVRSGLDPQSPPPPGYAFLDREVRIDRKGAGGPRWFTCAGAWVHEEDDAADAFFDGGGRRYLLLVAADITSLRQQQDKARMAALQAMLADEERINALRESLSAAVFQLEGPLNMVASAVGMLARRGAPDGNPMAAALDDAVKSGERALSGLRAMIPAPRGEAASTINANELLRDVLDLSTGRLLAAGIRVNWKPQAVLPALHGHPNRLRSLFKALIDNAIEAMSTRGWRERELTVSSSAGAREVEIVIEDSGPGIPPALQLKVFEPFFTTRRDGRGSRHLGTGLSSAQQIVAEHGGTLDIDPAARKGCRLRVRLPLAAR